MFDFGAISNVAETLETGVRDIDSRLESLVNLMVVQNQLLSDLVRLLTPVAPDFDSPDPRTVMTESENRLDDGNR